MKLDANIFKAYDIRGITPTSLNPEIARRLGRAFGTHAIKCGERIVAVGRDGRLTGLELSQALIYGLCEAGVSVMDVGMVTTPQLYFAASGESDPACKSGIQITGSHNPRDYNGFKMTLGGRAIYGEEIQTLHRMMEAQWIEFVGRRDPGSTPPPLTLAPPARDARRFPAWARELAVAGIVVVAAVGVVRFSAAHVPPPRTPDPSADVYAAAQVRDLRQAVDLYARERGEYPRKLEDMIEDRWLEAGQLHVPGYAVHYHVLEGGRDYDLGLTPDR